MTTGLRAVEFPINSAGTHTLTHYSNGGDFVNVPIAGGYAVTEVRSSSGSTGLSIKFRDAGPLLGANWGGNAIPNDLWGGPWNAGDHGIDMEGYGSCTFTFTAVALAEFAVTTSGNTISVSHTDLGATLDITRSGDNITFASAGKSFTINYASSPVSGTTGPLSLAGKTRVRVNMAGGMNVVNVGDLGTAAFVLEINGSGNDTVNFNSGMICSNGGGVAVNITSGGDDVVHIASGTNFTMHGNAYVDLKASRTIAMPSGFTISTVDGHIALAANQQAAPTTGDFVGLDLEGIQLRSFGAGGIFLSGRGGSTQDDQLGVRMFSDANVSSKVITNSGEIHITGQGGTGSTAGNSGVALEGSGTEVTSNTGHINITGTGGANTTQNGIGVSILNGPLISTGANAALNITGTGASLAGSQSNYGLKFGGSYFYTHNGAQTLTGTPGPGNLSVGIIVDNCLIQKLGNTAMANMALNSTNAQNSASAIQIVGNAVISNASGNLSINGTVTNGNGNGLLVANSSIASLANGDLTLRGDAGQGSGKGFEASGNTLIQTAGTNRIIRVLADTFAIMDSASIQTVGTASHLTLESLAFLTVLEVADDSATLGLTSAEMGHISTPSFRLQNSGGAEATFVNTGTFTSTLAELRLTGTRGYFPNFGVGTDFNVPRLMVDTTLNVTINGTTANTNYMQMAVNGQVALNGKALVLSANPNFTAAVGQTFVLINNDGTDPIQGTFSNIPAAGALIQWPNDSSLYARYSYTGGDGNDFTITIIQGWEVTSLADSGPGTLRFYLTQAASTSGKNVITMADSIGSGTINLASQITINDPAGVEIHGDPGNPVTISGGNARRPFYNASGSSLTFYAVNFTEGNAASATPFSGRGGAIYSAGDLLLEACYFESNTASQYGGAVSATGTLDVKGCFFYANSVSGGAGVGGAIYSEGTLNIATSNFEANTASLNGGAVGNVGTMIAQSSWFDGNSAELWGGGIYSSGFDDILWSTFSRNEAYRGAGLYAEESVNIQHSTFADNTAEDEGGAIYFFSSGSTLQHCTIAANTADFAGGVVVYQSSPPFNGQINVKYSIISGNNGGNFYWNNVAPLNSVIGGDAKLAPLGSYGGPTPTMALLPGSPARNAATGSPAAFDQRFFLMAGVPDIGAYEAGHLDNNYNAFIYETLPASTINDPYDWYSLTADFDGDGIFNYHEWVAGTNVADPNSALRIRNFGSTDIDWFFDLQTVAGRKYTIERSTDNMETWHPLPDFPTWTGNGSLQNIAFSKTPGLNAAFYRISVSQ